MGDGCRPPPRAPSSLSSCRRGYQVPALNLHHYSPIQFYYSVERVESHSLIHAPCYGLGAIPITRFAVGSSAPNENHPRLRKFAKFNFVYYVSVPRHAVLEFHDALHTSFANAAIRNFAFHRFTKIFSSLGYKTLPTVGIYIFFTFPSCTNFVHIINITLFVENIIVFLF